MFTSSAGEDIPSILFYLSFYLISKLNGTITFIVNNYHQSKWVEICFSSLGG